MHDGNEQRSSKGAWLLGWHRRTRPRPLTSIGKCAKDFNRLGFFSKEYVADGLVLMAEPEFERQLICRLPHLADGNSQTPSSTSHSHCLHSTMTIDMQDQGPEATHQLSWSACSKAEAEPANQPCIALHRRAARAAFPCLVCFH